MLNERTITTSAGALRLTESDGVGMPILMIHGTGSCRAVFGKQLESALADQHRLIAVDLPGHGESADAADVAAYTLRGLTGVMTEVVHQLGLADALAHRRTSLSEFGLFYYQQQAQAMH